MIINYLLHHYELTKILNLGGKKHQLSFSLAETVTLLLCNRWQQPKSKLGVYETQTTFIGIQPIQLQWLYRSLDKLALLSEELQAHLYPKNTQFLDYQVDVVFYDGTTFYFDSSDEIEGALRQKGFGKDGKVGKTQILLGLLLDQKGNPLGYELYSGDTYEGHTLSDGLQKLKSKFNLNKVIVVADSGMLNSDNLLAINGKGYEFIVGERLKNLPKKVQEALLDRHNYQAMTLSKAGKKGKDIVISYHVITHKGRKILCTYSEKRAKKDRLEREQKIEKAKKRMKTPSQLGKKAAVYYLKSNQVDLNTGEIADAKSTKLIYELDEAKIAKAALYDGLKAITTSDAHLQEEEILLKYKELYQIEQRFRTFKSFLETRPMFHWTDERIRGHFCLCYLSFALRRFLQQVLKKNKLNLSETELRELFDKMQLTHLQQFKQDYYVRAPLEKEAQELLKILKIKPLPDTISNPTMNFFLKKGSFC